MSVHMQNVRQRLGAFFESCSYQCVLAFLIILSVFSIGHELSTEFHLEGTLNHVVHYFNQAVVIVFAVEVVVRLLAHGPSFFKDPWHVFDFIIIGISLASFGGFFQLFRAVRLFWLLRVFSIFPQFKHVIDSIIKAVPHMLSTGVILLVSIYIFSLLGVAIFGFDHPKAYGTVWIAMKTISQSVLLEHTWSDQIAELSETSEHAIWFVVPMIIVLNFLMLQMVFGVVINALIRQHQEEEHGKKHIFLQRWLRNKHTAEEEVQHFSAETKVLINEIQKLRQEIKDSKK